MRACHIKAPSSDFAAQKKTSVRSASFPCSRPLLVRGRLTVVDLSVLTLTLTTNTTLGKQHAERRFNFSSLSEQWLSLTSRNRAHELVGVTAWHVVILVAAEAVSHDVLHVRQKATRMVVAAIPLVEGRLEMRKGRILHVADQSSRPHTCKRHDRITTLF
jgi:hypothetical protein